jgi:hypothetical protein
MPSGRPLRRLFGLARLGADGLARRCGPDDGRPAGLAAAAAGSGSGLNCSRQAGESWDFLATMQAVTRLTSGISELQSRNASPVQACSCSGV